MAAIGRLALALDPGLTRVTAVAVGTTAVGVQTEFVGIAWNPLMLQVEYVGQAVQVDGVWQAYLTRYANGVVPPRVAFPAGVPLRTADSRGLAFVAGMAGGAPYLIGFMHNMLNLGNRTGAYDNIPTMTTRACQAMGGAYANARIIVGGDFNLLPRNPGTARSRGAMYFVAAEDDDGTYANTTVANAYDFWLVNFGQLTSDDVDILDQAFGDGGRSDHAGISLNF